MPNYAVEKYTTGPDPAATVAAALETKIETIDNAKTIRLLDMISVARDKDLCVGIIIYDT